MILETVTSLKPIDRYRALETKLGAMGRDIRDFRKKNIDTLREALTILENRIYETRVNSDYMGFMSDQKYVRDVYTKNALECLIEYKQDRDESVVLVPGMTYYSAKVEDGRVVGKKCNYLNESTSFWVQVNEDERIMKAKEVMAWGSDDNFRKIYFELADGKLFENFEKFDIQHITKSSDKALNIIEQYCNTVWEGKWPWEINVPNKLKSIIKENTEMTIKSVREYREEFETLRNSLFEGEIERSELISKLRGHYEDVDNMLEKIGRVAGNLLTDMKENIRSEFGDEAAERIETTLGDRLRSASNELGSLRRAWEEEIENLANGEQGMEAPEFDDPAVDDLASAPVDGEENSDIDQMPAFDDEDFEDEEDSEEDEEDLDLGAEREKK